MLSVDIKFQLKKIFRKLSVRASFFALAAFAGTLIAGLLGSYIPEDIASVLGTDAVEDLLKIIASSMLVVVTFSISTMVSAFATASQNITPRVTRILMEDSKSQNTISMFLGSFIFSIVSLVALSTKLYDKGEKSVLLVLTSFIILIIVYSIIVWIEELSRIGRVHDAIMKIEKSAEKTFIKLQGQPNFGATHYDELPQESFSIDSEQSGYIQNINFSKLAEWADEKGIKVYITVNIGDFITSGTNIIKVVSDNNYCCDDKEIKTARGVFSISDSRTFDNDTRFHFVVMAEICSRALSPSINDPGTAIDVTRSFQRLLSVYDMSEEDKDITYKKLYYKKFPLKECIGDFLRPVSRDGSRHVEVLVNLLKALSEIEEKVSAEERDSIKNFKNMVCERGCSQLTFDDDIQKVKNYM